MLLLLLVENAPHLVHLIRGFSQLSKLKVANTQLNIVKLNPKLENLVIDNVLESLIQIVLQVILHSSLQDSGDVFVGDSLIDLRLGSVEDEIFKYFYIGKTLYGNFNFVSRHIIIARIHEILLPVVPVIDLHTFKLLKFLQNLLILLISIVLGVLLAKLNLTVQLTFELFDLFTLVLVGLIMILLLADFL